MLIPITQMNQRCGRNLQRQWIGGVLVAVFLLRFALDLLDIDALFHKL